MRFARLNSWYQRLPLKAKLTLWNSIVVLLVATASMLLLREGRRWTMTSELQSALTAQAFEIVTLSNHPRADFVAIQSDLESIEENRLRPGWFLELFDSQRQKMIWSSAATPTDLINRGLDTDETDLNLDGQKYRCAYGILHVADGQSATFRVGAPLTTISAAVASATRIILIVMSLLLLIAPIGGYLLANRVTAPLQKIIETTTSLGAHKLDERLTIRGTGDELDQLSLVINQLLDEIATHLQRNRDFVADAAHELRSPLTAIIASVEVALVKTRTPGEYKDLLASVLDQCRKLARLSNQLLVLAESDAGTLESESLDTVPLDTIVADVAEMFRGTTEEKLIALNVDVEDRVRLKADPVRIRQVVTNLIDNAFKFTESGGAITVGLKFDPERQMALIRVSDTGVGIPIAVQPHVFDRFFQADSSRRLNTPIHGTGLGLSICKAIVEAYGGTISVSSHPNQGSTFTIELPCEEGHPAYRASSRGFGASVPR